MSDQQTALPGSLVSYFRANESLSRLLLTIPEESSNPLFQRDFQELVKLPPHHILPMMETPHNSNAELFLARKLCEAQSSILSLARNFKENDTTFYLEHPQVFLPIANLPAAQQFPLLTPGNYAAEVTKLFHSLFRRWFPGATFRKRKDCFVLSFDGNSSVRAHGFFSFMEQDSYWNNYLKEKNNAVRPTLSKFHDSYSNLKAFLVNDSNTAFFKMSKSEKGLVESIRFVLPTEHTAHKRSLKDLDGNEHHYLRTSPVKILTEFIKVLAPYAYFTAVLASAYPTLKAQASREHAIVSKKESEKNHTAFSFIHEEMESRVVTVTPDVIATLSEPMKAYVHAARDQETGRMFLPVTDRGFKKFGAHHIYVSENKTASHLSWTPLPPINKKYDASLNFNGLMYAYQGISEQTGYFIDSPRSTHGKTPHVFKSLLYTAIHVPAYNKILLEQLDTYDMFDEMKALIRSSVNAVDFESLNFLKELDTFVTQMLFTEAPDTPTEEPDPAEDAPSETEQAPIVLSEQEPSTTSDDPELPSNYPELCVFSFRDPNGIAGGRMPEGEVRITDFTIAPHEEDTMQFKTVFSIAGARGYVLDAVVPLASGPIESLRFYRSNLIQMTERNSMYSVLYDAILTHLDQQNTITVGSETITHPTPIVD